MRPPRHIVITEHGIDADGNLSVTVHLRLWHPGAWHSIWQALPEEVPALVKPFAFAYVLARIAADRGRCGGGR